MCYRVLTTLEKKLSNNFSFHPTENLCHTGQDLQIFVYD
uniref:Uncharacterized protein n=1 Tax=Anguilla anguilla TaxID=7936 RepID=A0A0E9W4Q3_ANGAN